jgi:hypothetical protein
MTIPFSLQKRFVHTDTSAIGVELDKEVTKVIKFNEIIMNR